MNNDFKNAIKGVRKLQGKITVGENVYDNEDNVYIKPRFNVELFKTVMKAVDFETTAKIDSMQWVNIQIGVLVDEEYEYVDFGDYYINDEPTWNMDTSSWTYKAYDKMIEAMIPYQELEIEYPITYKNKLITICDFLGWEYELGTFPNDDNLIQRDLYKDLGLTFRDVLDDLCVLSMGNFTNDGTFKIIYPTDTDHIIDEDWLNEDNTQLFDAVKPINSLVLSRAEGGDKIYRNEYEEDEGLSEIEIKDNIILSSEYREDYIDEMFNFIKGFTYTPFNVETIGTLWFKPLDKFTIRKDSVDYETILLNYEIDYADGLKEFMFSPKLEQATTDYKTSALTDRASKMANILAYKNQARIELLTQDIEDSKSKTASLEIRTEAIEGQVSKIEGLESQVSTLSQTTEGLDLKLKKIGGANLVIDSTGIYKNDKVWNGMFDTLKDNEVLYLQENEELQRISDSKSAWIISNDKSGYMEQTILAPAGTYTISAKAKVLNHFATINFIINGVTKQLTNGKHNEWNFVGEGEEQSYTFTTTSGNITIGCETDMSNAGLLTDLMLNGETIAMKWQPANGEVILGNVEMGYDGVTVGQRSGKNTNLSEDGLRLKTGDVITSRATDTGFDTNDITARKGTIAGIRMTRKEKISQSWIGV